MKKLVTYSLAMLMVLSLAGCSNSADINHDADTNNTENEAQKNTQEDSDAESNYTDEAADDYLHTLKPTHELASPWPFEQIDDKRGSLWVPGMDITDLSHLTNPYYKIKPTVVYMDDHGLDPLEYHKLTWDQVKDMKLGWIGDKMSIYSDDYDNYIVAIGLDEDNAAEMTMTDAIAQGYWHYSFGNSNGMSVADFFSNPPEMTCVEAVISTWGMPSEIYYDYFDDYLNLFALLYETEEYTVIFEGYDYPNHTRTTIQLVHVCGKNYHGGQPYDGYFDIYDEKFE